MVERDFNEADDQRVAYRLLSNVLDSTTTSLTSGSTYTGDAFDVEGFEFVVLTFTADQDALVRVQYRNDTANWDAQEQYDYTGGNKLGLEVKVMGKEARIEIENDSGADITGMRMHARGRV